MRTLAVAALPAFAAVAAGGCGGSGRTAVPPSHGRGIFAHACAGCHTLAGRESGAVGGDLLNAHLSVANLASFAKVMPTRPPLTQAEADIVAEYIHSFAPPPRSPGD